MIKEKKRFDSGSINKKGIYIAKLPETFVITFTLIKQNPKMLTTHWWG